MAHRATLLIYSIFLPKILGILTVRGEIDNFRWSAQLNIVYARWDWWATKVTIHPLFLWFLNLPAHRSFIVINLRKKSTNCLSLTTATICKHRMKEIYPSADSTMRYSFSLKNILILRTCRRTEDKHSCCSFPVWL